MVSRYTLIRHGESSRRNLRFLFLSAIFLFGCRPAPPPPPSNETQTVSTTEATSIPMTPTAAPEQVKQIRNGQYQLGAADVPRMVQLTNGKFEQGTQGGPAFVSVSVTDFVAG